MKNSLKQCVVIVNPGSTHQNRGARFLKQLQTMYPKDKLTVVKTSKRDYENPDEFVSKLDGLLNSHTLLGVSGGDGSMNYVVNLLLTHGGFSSKARKAVLLPLWGGNANDLAYMANGLPFAKNMRRIVAEGSIVNIQPLHVDVQSGKDQMTKLAICYASFGASAFVAHKLNQPKHRNKRVYHLPGTRTAFEAGSVTKALVDAPRFQCEIDGVTQPLYDLMLINGSRIAKVDRAPITLTDPYFYEIRTTQKRPVILAYATSVLRGITQRRAPIARRTLIAHDPTWVQMDGEVQRIPDESEVTVTLFDKPLRLLSTKLTNDEVAS